MPAAFGRNAYAIVPYGSATPTLYLPPRINRSRVRVLSGGVWVDLSSRVFDVTAHKRKEDATTEADVTLANAPSDGDDLSHRNGGPIAPGTQIQIDAAFTTDGSQPTDADLYPVFYGELGSSIKSSNVPGERTLQVHALDLASKRLGRYFLNDATGITPGSADTVIQAIADKAAPGMFTVYTPATITATVTQNGLDNLTQNTNAWAAIQAIAEQSGLDARWAYVPSVGDWRIVVQAPQRDLTTPDLIVDASGRYRDDLDETDSYIRNRVVVEYRNSATGERATAEWRNDDPDDPYSIPNWGESAVYITEADNSIIDTATEAQAEADIIGDDVGGIYERYSLDLPFEPSLEPFQRLLLSDEGVIHAVEDVELQMSGDGEWSTTATMAGKQTLRRDAWLAKHGGTGTKRPLRTGDYRSASVETGTLQDASVADTKLQDGAVGTSKLGDTAVSAQKIKFGDLSGSGTFGPVAPGEVNALSTDLPNLEDTGLFVAFIGQGIAGFLKPSYHEATAVDIFDTTGFQTGKVWIELFETGFVINVKNVSGTNDRSYSGVEWVYRYIDFN